MAASLQIIEMDIKNMAKRNPKSLFGLFGFYRNIAPSFRCVICQQSFPASILYILS